VGRQTWLVAEAMLE